MENNDCLKKNYCKCGCGAEIAAGNTYKSGHQCRTCLTEEYIKELESLKTIEIEMEGKEKVKVFKDIFCACGCGERIEAKEYLRYYKIPKYKHGHNFKNKSQSSEHKRKIGLGNKEKIHSLKQNKYHSNVVKKLWQTPEFVTKQMKARNVCPNKTEKFLEKLLHSWFPNQWEYTGDGKFILAGKCPDFKHKTEKKLIELFGDYWHGEERTGIAIDEHTQDRIARFKQEGYETLIIWEHELEDISTLKIKVNSFQEVLNGK